MPRRAGAPSPGHHSQNFVPHTAPGCHVCHGVDAPWVLGHEAYDPDDFEPGAVLPDVATDPETGVVTAVNTSSHARVLVLSTSHPCTGKHGVALQPGTSRDDDGRVHGCTTLVLVLPPATLLHCVRLPRAVARAPDIQTDVQVLTRHATPADADARHVFHFPLPVGGPFLCSQAFGGAFTHFHAQTHHALDFCCRVGTPVHAMAPGRVVDVRTGHTCTGVHVSNLFSWNGVLVQLQDGCCIEYVHVSAVHVAPGADVQVGQHIADSGDVGFSPVPHLHVQLLQDASPTSWTRGFSLRDARGGAYTPVAGAWYDAAGEAKPPPAGA